MEKTMTKETARMNIYQFMSLAFYEPSREVWKALKLPENIERLQVASEVYLTPEAREDANSIFEELAKAYDEEEFVDLKAEYTRLFIGPHTPAAPPYESVYDKKRTKQDWGTMVGPSSDSMKRILDNEGLVITLEFAELPDHVAIELEVMYYFLHQTLEDNEVNEKYLAKANKFLHNHLGAWMPEFGHFLSNRTESSFYKALGQLLNKLIKLDLAEYPAKA